LISENGGPSHAWQVPAPEAHGSLLYSFNCWMDRRKEQMSRNQGDPALLDRLNVWVVKEGGAE